MTESKAQRPSFLAQVPIGRALVDPLSSEAVDRMWVVVEARLPRLAASEQRRRGNARHWFMAAVALTALTVFVFWHASLPQPTAGPLLLADGTQFDRVVSHTGPETRRFADGSSLRVDANGEVVSLASTPREFVVLLERGRVHFHVMPGGPRRWTVELGLGRVEVVGTEFWVERQPKQVSIVVSRGKVLVRSSLLPDEVRAVAPGEIVVLNAVERQEGGGPLAAPSTAKVPAEQQEGRSGSSPESVVRAPAADAVAALFREADRARIERDFDRAARIFEHIVMEHPADARAALASYSHGVLALRQLGQANRAAVSFERALALGAPRTLREDCYLAWLEAELLRGDRARAQELFTLYLDEFPKGRHRLEMQRVLGGDTASPE